MRCSQRTRANPNAEPTTQPWVNLGYCCRSRCIRLDTDGSLEDDADVPIVGFSATFSRHDTLALSAVFEEIVFHRDVGYMLEEGWCVAR